MARHHGMWSSITTEILAEMRARSAQEPGAEQPCFRRTSSGHTARCIEGPVRLRQQEDTFIQHQRLLNGLPSSADDRASSSSSSSSSSVCQRALPAKEGGGSDRPVDGRETRTPWERSVETKVPPHFATSGSRRLIHPAPLHAGHQPANEPALPAERHDGGWEAARESDGGAGQLCDGDGSTVGQGEPQARKFAEGWIPAHEVYNDTEEVSWRQRHQTDLRFESRFESGNLASAVRLSGCEYNLYLRADKGSGGCQWYYFMVSNMKKDCTYKLNIMHFYKEKSMYHHGMRPLLWSQTDSQRYEPLGWRRAGSHIRYYENGVKKKNGGRNFTLSFAIEFPHDDDVVFIAMCYPFTYSDLGNLLLEAEVLSQKRRIMTRNELCKTEGGVSCEILAICNPRPSSQVERRPVLFISGRVHPGESNASYIVKGAIQFLVSDDNIAQVLRDHFVFEVIPMLNPDGVIHGHYRASLSGDDLNRNWTEPSKERHPTIYYAKRRLKTLAGEGRLFLYCDVHGHSTKKNVFMYGCNSAAFGSSHFGAVEMHQKAYRREQQFPKLFSQRWPCVSFKDCHFEVDKKKENTGRAAVARECAIIHSYTLEASFCGSNLLHDGSEDATLTHFTAADLERTGLELCKALGAYAADQDHGWDLEEGAKTAIRQALLRSRGNFSVDGPPPGASVLDFYYESLKKCESEKALTRKNTLADVVADVLTIGSNAHKENGGGSPATSDPQHQESPVEDGVNAPEQQRGIHRSISDPALGSSLLCDSPSDETSLDAGKARGRGVRPQYRHQRVLRPRRKNMTVEGALTAVFGASPSGESMSPNPQGEMLQLVAMTPSPQKTEETLVFMTDRERRKKEEQDPGIKFLRVGRAKHTFQESASPSRTSEARTSPSRADVNREQHQQQHEEQQQHRHQQQQQQRVSLGTPPQHTNKLGEGNTKFVRISRSRLHEMDEGSSSSLLHDFLPPVPVPGRHDATITSSSKSLGERRSPHLSGAGGGSWPAMRGAAGSGNQRGDRGGRQGGFETTRQRVLKTARGGAVSADVPESYTRLLEQRTQQTSGELMSFKRSDEQILNRLNRIVARGSNGVEISSPILSKAAPRLGSAGTGFLSFRKSLTSTSLGSNVPPGGGRARAQDRAKLQACLQ